MGKFLDDEQDAINRANLNPAPPPMAQHDPSLYQSVQPPRPPAAAYAPYQDLFGVNLETGQQSPRVTQKNVGTLKRMLLGGLTSMSESMIHSSGAMTPDEKDQLQAETQFKIAQTEAAKQATVNAASMVTLQNGVQVPFSVAQKAYPALFNSQSRERVAQINAQSKENISAFNNHLKALGLGAEVGVDDDGNFTWKSIPKEDLPAPVAAKADKVQGGEIGLIIRAQQGDQEAAQALQTLQNNRMALMKERTKGLGQARLYQLQKAMDPETGEASYYTGFDILNAKQQGKNLIPMGPLSSKDLISVQQLQSEATPAIQSVRDNLGAFDNANDRAIFARVMKSAGTPQRGNEASWMGNVLDQAMKQGLSEQGMKLAQSEARLAETMGRLRSTLGLPATDQSMAITLALLPGATTPNSKFAKGQVDQIEQMVKQAVSVPIYGGSGGSAAHGSKPKSGNNDPLGIR